MWRYPDGTYRINPPTTVVLNGFVTRFNDLTREQWDELNYNEAIPIKREQFTTHQTQWVKDDDLVYREEVISAVVDEAAKYEAEANVVRIERDQLLAACDWTQLADCPLDEADRIAWANYRQGLRDVPQQAGFPGAVEWPEAG